MSQPLNTINEPKNKSLMVHVILIDDYSFVFEIKDGKTYSINRPKNDTWLKETVSTGDTLLVQFVEHETTRKGMLRTNVRLELVEKISGEYSMSNTEPLKMTETFIRHFPQSGYYDFEVQDQYERWWIYSGSQDSLAEIEEIEAEECRKDIINLDLYHLDDNRIVNKIKRHAEVMYVFGYNINSEVFQPDLGAEVRVIINEGRLSMEYSHDKIFHDYDKLKEFALKIKDKGIINLEFWNCLGSYEWEDNCSEHLEFEDKSEYYEEPREWGSMNIYNSLEGEHGERKYMSDGAWMNPDGTIDFER